jgi:lysophospholipase L1-like esterase
MPQILRQMVLAMVMLIGALVMRGQEEGVRLPTLFIAGDSTAARYGEGAMQGWGEAATRLFEPAKVRLENRARGGRSSRTFITEGWWTALLADVRAGDVVLIQFGHNDGGAINEEPPGSTRPVRARGSLPGIGDETVRIQNVVTGEAEVVRTFGAYLREMIGEVRERGATPVVLSTTPRNAWDAAGRVERGGAHRRWSRAVARAEGVAWVDLTRLVADAYQELGEAAAGGLFAGDNTHTNAAGAEFNAIHVVAGLKGLRGGPEIAPWLSAAGAAVRRDDLGWLDLPEPVDVTRPTVWLIGDSTVRNGGGDGGNGEWGWGEPLAEVIDPATVNVVNRAIGGLSSRTFLTAGHWARVRSMLRPGDWVVMQFGHNDAAALNDASRARGTVRGVGDEAVPVHNLITGELEVVRSYGGYLRRYIAEARERGAIPVVVTPIPRKVWRDGRITREPESYPGWAAAVAAAEDVRLIDLHNLVADRYDALGAAAVEAFFADERTHTSRAGAELNAELVATALAGWEEFPGRQRE